MSGLIIISNLCRLFRSFKHNHIAKKFPPIVQLHAKLFRYSIWGQKTFAVRQSHSPSAVQSRTPSAATSTDIVIDNLYLSWCALRGSYKYSYGAENVAVPRNKWCHAFEIWKRFIQSKKNTRSCFFEAIDGMDECARSQRGRAAPTAF